MWWNFRWPFKLVLSILVICKNTLVSCESTGNSEFNASLRDFSSASTFDGNTSEVKTLQKESPQIYNHRYNRVYNPIRFKETADNSLSSSSYSRGFAPHDYSGYNFNGYEIGPYESGGFENIHHLDQHEPHYELDHGHRHKVQDHHALAVKTFLWPLAGIALLGAAAALVTNPVLLQLGVVSGRRKRSTIIETTTAKTTKFDNIESIIKMYKANKEIVTTDKTEIAQNKYESYPIATRRSLTPKLIINRVNTKRKRGKIKSKESDFKIRLDDDLKWNDKRLIPIPLKFNNLP